MPTLTNSIDLPGLAEELAWTANAYLDGAIYVCEGLLENEHENSSHHFRVPLHLGYLSLELYLKAGIALGGSLFSPTHDLDKLQREYDRAKTGIKLPTPSYFSGFTPTSLDLFREHKAPTSSWHFERLRYSSDKSGVQFPKLEMADVRALNDDLHALHRAGSQLLFKTWRDRPKTKRKKARKKGSGGRT
jgi:hypothetical protein